MTAQPTTSELLSMIANMKATNDALMAKLADAQKPRSISFKVSEKGCLSVYGLNIRGIHLYISQWERIFAAQDQIKAFAKANDHLLTRKTPKGE